MGPFFHNGASRHALHRRLNAGVPRHSASLGSVAGGGFTLVEMLVVLAIISIITIIVITSQSAFNKTLILANAAYDVALTIRSAQSYGVGSRAGTGVSRAGYGLSFRGFGNGATPSSFIFFADSSPGPSELSSRCHPADDYTAPDAKAGDCAYQAGQDVKISDFALHRGISFKDLCTYTAGTWQCANSNGNAITSFDIVFVRPDPAPYMSKNGSYVAGNPVTKMCLTLASPQGGTRYVSVTSSGEINADAPSCPLP